MGCRKCENYSRALLRCKLGMINPRTIKGACEAARVMGISYICDKEGMRKKASQAFAKEIAEDLRGG